MNDIIRVFPRRTKWTPTDKLAFVGDPPLFSLTRLQVFISVTFTWDIQSARIIQKNWQDAGFEVKIGGPAFGDFNGEFIPGRFIKTGVTITSRGCPKKCAWCFVPHDGKRPIELEIKPGYIVQDDNLLACTVRHIETVFEMLKWQSEPIEFKGGLDIDYLQYWHVDLLKRIKVAELWISCDSEQALSKLDKAADLLADFPIDKKRCYVLVGFNGEGQEQAQKRCETVLSKGFLPYAQLYRDSDSTISRGQWHDFCAFWSQPRLYRKTIQCK